MSLKSIRLAVQRKCAASALRKAIPHQFSHEVSDVLVTRVDSFGARFTAQFEGCPLEGTLSRRTIVEQSARGNAVRVLREVSLAPSGVWQGTAHNMDSLRKLIEAAA